MSKTKLGRELTPAQIEKILNEMGLFVRLEYPRSACANRLLSDLMDCWSSLFTCEEETMIVIAPKHLLDLNTPKSASEWTCRFVFPHYEFLQAVYYNDDSGNVKVDGNLIRITDKMYNEIKRYLWNNPDEHIRVIETVLIDRPERCETESVIAYKAGGVVITREDFADAKRYRDEILDEFFTWLNEVVEYKEVKACQR